MHPSKRVFQNRGHKKKPTQVKSQSKRRHNHSNHRPYHRMDDNVTQAELDASIEHIVEKQFIIKVPREHQDLLKQHLQLKRDIKNIDNRLTFGYSEPLQDYRDGLLKEDFKILTKITDILTGLNSL